MQVELFTQPRRIGVNGLTDENFIAYGNNFGFHQAKVTEFGNTQSGKYGF